MSYTANARLLKQELDRNQQTVRELEAAGGLRIQLRQSDKLGYDWKQFYVNGVLVRSDYFPQQVVMGTPENPLPWQQGLALIPNGCYIHQGIRKVWMGAAGTAAAWDGEGWEVF